MPETLGSPHVRSLGSVLFVVLSGCVAPPGTREVRVDGLPTCPKGKGYARKVVVRLDRDRSLFDEAVMRTATFELPPPASPILTVPRGRMLMTLRAGLCAPTSLGTWDCNAVLWLSSQQLQFDGGKGAYVARLPALAIDCTR